MPEKWVEPTHLRTMGLDEFQALSLPHGYGDLLLLKMWKVTRVFCSPICTALPKPCKGGGGVQNRKKAEAGKED